MHVPRACTPDDYKKTHNAAICQCKMAKRRVRRGAQVNLEDDSKQGRRGASEKWS
jgi:hypothetical protein